MNLQFLIDNRAILRDALKKIESNTHGIVFVVDHKNIILGGLSDGDVRRHLLNSGSLDDVVTACMNKSFQCVKSTTHPEVVAKLLDSLRVVPVLDDDGAAINFLTRLNNKHFSSGRRFSRSKTPVRISFGGGGSDLTYFFSKGFDAAVVNATIKKYTYAFLEQRYDNKIEVKSYDLQDNFTADSLDDLVSAPSKFSLIIEAIKCAEPNFGFNLELMSDFEPGSGLGGSAAVVVNILNCFNEFRDIRWSEYELATEAYKIERHILNINGGWQDQYAAAFGGINYISFSSDKNVVYPLRIPENVLSEFESNLFLCPTNISHHSGEIHNDQQKTVQSENLETNIKANVKLCQKMRDDLLRGDLDSFAVSLDSAWQLKKTFSTKISNDKIDKIYECGKSLGAIGGKLLGAGGGGYVLFYVNPKQHICFIEGMKNENLHVERVHFSTAGAHSWRGIIS